MKKNAIFAIAFAASMASGCVPDPRIAALEAMCKEADISLLRTPSLQVRSIAHDWNPAELPDGPFYGAYRITDDGRLRGASGFERDSYFDFVERRHSINTEGLDPQEMRRPARTQRMVRYKVTVSDRRTGDTLATMIYGVDMLNQHACRANRPNLISVNAFVRDAVGANRLLIRKEFVRCRLRRVFLEVSLSASYSGDGDAPSDP